MRRLSAIAFCLVGAVLCAGCVSEREAQRRQAAAYSRGIAEARNAMEARMGKITFDGPVRNAQIEWREGLTLAEAIVEAVYTGAVDPGVIVVFRNGEPNFIDARELVSGVDYELESGDVVQFR